jgi:hypothetical protein
MDKSVKIIRYYFSLSIIIVSVIFFSSCSIDKVEKQYAKYKDLVEEDGGSIDNEVEILRTIGLIHEEKLEGSLIFYVSKDFGIKKNDVSEEKYVEVAYDISNRENHIIQSQGDFQPHLLPQGMLFDGIRTHFLKDIDELSGEFTIACWVKPAVRQTGNYREIISLSNTDDGNNTYISLMTGKVDNSTLFFRTQTAKGNDNFTQAKNTVNIDEANWWFLLGTVGNGSVALYRNAEKIYEGSRSGEFNINRLEISRKSHPYLGLGNDFMVFNKVLSEKEVEYLYRLTRYKYEFIE